MFRPFGDLVAPLGTLSENDDDGGSENVGKKVNSCSFKLYRAYLPRSIRQMLANFPGVEFLRI